MLVQVPVITHSLDAEGDAAYLNNLELGTWVRTTAPGDVSEQINIENVDYFPPSCKVQLRYRYVIFYNYQVREYVI